MKYPSNQEADECFNRLLSNIQELRELNPDVKQFFRSYRHMHRDCPFFIELLDLNDEFGQDQQQVGPTLTTTIEEMNPNSINEPNNGLDGFMDSEEIRDFLKFI